VSRLDSVIRRLEAQRACLGLAAQLIDPPQERPIAGVVLELGLGNGRTYDHLRTLLPGREIYVCERRVAAHPDCIPPDDHLVLGDMRETLPGLAGRFGARVALAHFDVGTGDAAGNHKLAALLAPLILPLLAIGAILVSDPPIALDGLAPLALPAGVRPGRYHLYRRAGRA
jgi:hypothetical protein